MRAARWGLVALVAVGCGSPTAPREDPLVAAARVYAACEARAWAVATQGGAVDMTRYTMTLAPCLAAFQQATAKGGR